MGVVTAAFTNFSVSPTARTHFAGCSQINSEVPKCSRRENIVRRAHAAQSLSLTIQADQGSAIRQLRETSCLHAHFLRVLQIKSSSTSDQAGEECVDGNGRGTGGGDNPKHRPEGDGDEESFPFITHLAALVYCASRRTSSASANYVHASLFGTALLATQLGESRHFRHHVPGSVTDAAAFVGDSQRPVVILLSWLGAQQRHMIKYAEWYRARGYDVVTLFNGLQTALIPTFSRRQALRLLQLIDEIPENRPIVVHSFSIGTGIYGYMLDFVHKGQYITEEMGRKLHRQIRGVIFDSGPGHMHASSLARGLYSACPKIGYRVWNAVAEGLFRFLNVAEGFRAAEHALQNVQLPSVPQLYLYSLDDTVVKDLDKSVRQYIDAQRQRGLEVYHKVWEQSQHATHFKLHPEEYKAQVESFLRRALSDVEYGMRDMFEKLHDAATGSSAKSNTMPGVVAP